MRYHPEQIRLLQSQKRFKAVVAGRGSGKTELARREIVIQFMRRKPWPDPKYFYVLPTLNQASRVAWDDILSKIPPEVIRRKNENKGFIENIYGARIYVVSAENPERLEGVQWDGGIIDESSDIKEGVFGKNLGPALSHRKAWCWRIGIPKRRGIGGREFKEFFDLGVSGDPDIDSFHWVSADILSVEELEHWKKLLSPQDFREQYEASWELSTGLVFPDFSKENITEAAVYHPNLPIIVGSDFNVDPMAWVMCHMVDGKLHVFDELFIRGTNTKQTLQELYNRYPTHKAGWIFIGDATSRARKTAASASDYVQIANFGLFSPKHLFYPDKNPAVADRIACCNAAICNAKDERRVFVNPKCTNLIKDFQFRYYKEGTSIINDSGDLGHITDAIGYVIWQVLPLRLETTGVPKVITKAG